MLFFKVNMIINNKITFKLLIYFFFVLLIIISLIFIKNYHYVFKSKLDQNYWIYKIHLNDKKNIGNDLYNLITVSKNNEKYKSKSYINFIYFYDLLDEETVNKLLKILQ